ncbi:hypothetical protein ACIRF8_12950 [Streptomyces sp. NPDC102406]|uniref:hypothetical protein n=1 Tax=Streptomyces sp. NPDC102406 TaxID=3366171 RepID=UPI00381B5DA2
MVFPQTPLNFTVELWYDGAWQNITSDVRHSDKITITRGRRAESGQPEPGSCRMTLRNRDAKYTPGNPTSPLYGKIGRNTLLRVMVNGVGRFVGEVSTWPPQWTEGGKDAWVSIEASGILRRIDQRKSPLQSTLRRRITSDSSVLGYWPMEEDAGATSAYSPLPGVPPLRVSGFIFAAEDSLAGSAPLPSLMATASMQGTVPAATSTGEWTATCLFNVASAPAVTTSLLEITTSGTAGRRFLAQMFPGTIRLTALDPDGVETILFNFSPTQFYGGWVRLEVTAKEIGGGTTRIHFGWRVLANDSGFGDDYLLAGTSGTVTGVTSNFSPAIAGAKLGHLGVFSSASTLIYSNAESGFVNEAAHTRFQRLCTEEGISSVLLGSDGALMGPQSRGRLLDLLYECADADGGIIYESRVEARLNYRTRASLYNQPPKLALDYRQHLMPGLAPVSDDQTIVNDFTVSRTNGSSARYVQSTGPLSTQDAPAGVGKYDQAATVNVATDAQLPDIAAWEVHLGTVDEPRYPTIPINLARNYTLAAAAMELVAGDRITISNTPSWLPPDGVDVIVQGFTETVASDEWTIQFVGSPASPWTVADTGTPSTPGTWTDTDGSVLAVAMTSAQTTALVHTTSGPVWSTNPVDMPCAVRVGGEVMQASAIASAGLDTFTRTVSSGWGTANTGQTWVLAGGSASERSTDGTRGVVTIPNASVSTARFQTLGLTLDDCEIRVRVSPGQVSTGNSMLPSVVLRYVDSATNYRARIHLGTGGAMGVSVTLGATQLGTAPLPYTYAANDTFEMRARVDGNRVRARVWPTASTEPTVWHIDQTVTTSPVASGAVGVVASGFSGNTNTNPILTFDNFEIVTPQLFTVTRSVNGVVKAQNAGADVRLATPAIVAL